ncbi:hypothetical protein BJV82DRAFT_676181 [Fennellomyces sp. T-0311]|nr:hypothetical protein BJV82DRAFT_676181 [Fennellomyces sp. T-0311]
MQLYITFYLLYIPDASTNIYYLVHITGRVESGISKKLENTTSRVSVNSYLTRHAEYRVGYEYSGILEKPTLTIHDYFESDGSTVDDRIRTHESFFNREQKGFAFFDYGETSKYGQLMLLFKCIYRGQDLYLALAREFVSQNKEHKSGFEVLKQALHYNYNGLFIADVTRIQRSISIVPDFSSRQYFSLAVGDVVFDQYLLNHDADRSSWFNKRGCTPTLQTKVDWDYNAIPAVGSESDDEDGEDEDESDDNDDSDDTQ